MLTATVIGCGYGGGLSLAALQNSNLFALIAAADPSADARRAVKTRLPPVRRFADYRDMLSKAPADVICVATPAPTHASIAREAMRHNPKGLLLEKPLACKVDTAEGLLRDLRRAGLPVVVPHGMLVLPAPQAVKARIRRGDIGEVRSIEVQNAVDLLNAGIHWLVYWLDVFDDAIPTVVSAEFETGDHAVNDAVQVESRGLTKIRLRPGLEVSLKSGVRTEPNSTVLPRDAQRGALFRVSGSKGVIEFSAWAGSYFIQIGESRGELNEQPLPVGSSYHQLFLERLAQNVIDGEAEYGVAELSLAALRLIESAYSKHRGGWALGVPAG